MLSATSLTWRGWFLRNSGNGCHIPNICSGNRSTLVLRETSLRAVDACRPCNFPTETTEGNVVAAVLVTIILSPNNPQKVIATEIASRPFSFSIDSQVSNSFRSQSFDRFLSLGRWKPNSREGAIGRLEARGGTRLISNYSGGRLSNRVSDYVARFDALKRSLCGTIH